MTSKSSQSASPQSKPTNKADRRKGSNFRFYDNRQKYLMFVNTCSEKWVVAERLVCELDRIRPAPPALRFFDAGVGDGTVLARVLRGMHERFPRVPLFVAGKEISLEDVRLTLDKMPDRFVEHPETVLALTNIAYADAPSLTPQRATSAQRVVWKHVALSGSTSADFERQIGALQPFMSSHWRTCLDERTGGLVPETPTVLLLFRDDCRFLLDTVIPRRDEASAGYDLVLASQPFRLRADIGFKARRVLAPLARALRPGGRMLAIHSAGDDPALEIVQQVWTDENPFTTTGAQMLEAVRQALGPESDSFTFDPPDAGPERLRYQMHTLPGEIGDEETLIGTSTLLAAWNAATYVAQIEDERLTRAMGSTAYLDATRDVLRKHGSLWFNDDCYVIVRRS